MLRRRSSRARRGLGVTATVQTPFKVPTVAPDTADELATVLDGAGEENGSVLVWGGGFHQGYGHRVEPSLVVSTSSLDRVIDYQPEDLTLVVEAGAKIGEIEALLANDRRTTALPESSPGATVGGVVAAGISGFRRFRYGPTRDRVLEVSLATGDGRMVRGGGRVVKNVTGYDLPRLATGSFGSLGVITSVCLKLWPLAEASATVPVDDPARAVHRLYRPLAVLRTETGSHAYIQGTSAEVESQAERVADSWSDGLEWPQAPQGKVSISIRVPPASTATFADRLPSDWRYVAQYGVGDIHAAFDEFDLGFLERLRSDAEHAGGALVLAGGPDSLYAEFGPWGSPPPGLAIQRRLIAGFDPRRVVNPGRMPGGI